MDIIEQPRVVAVTSIGRSQDREIASLSKELSLHGTLGIAMARTRFDDGEGAKR